MIKKIIFGCMLSTFILLMIPAISAIEYNNVIDENKLNIINEIETLDFEDFIHSITETDDSSLLFLVPPSYLEKKSKLYGNNGDLQEDFDHKGLHLQLIERAIQK